MHALAPLLFILIVFNSEQIKQDKLYRANVFSLVGICYFFMLQYTIYWYRVFPSESISQYLPGLLFVSFTVALLLSPWLKKSHPAKTAVFVSICIVSISLTFVMDYSIKEKLAELGGFFKETEVVEGKSLGVRSIRVVELPKIGAKLHIPESWVVKVASSGHSFFELFEDGQKVLEVRPNCLGEFELDTPTYIDNILSFYEAGTLGEQHSYECSQVKSEKECLIKVSYSKARELKDKWH